MFTKLIKYLYYYKNKYEHKKEEKLLIKKHPEWSLLTNKERKMISSENLQINIIMKNLSDLWTKDNCKFYISDFNYQTQILPKLNKINYDIFGKISGNNYFTDKNFQEKMIENIDFAKCIYRCINNEFYDCSYNRISRDDVINILSKYDKVVFKKTIDSSHGRGVSLIKKDEYESNIDTYGENYIVQEIIRQNDFLAQFNKSSVNVIRVTSLLYDGEVRILSSVLRVGAPGSFCDHQGFNKVNPRVVKIDNNGNLVGKAIDPDECFKYDDIFGTKITGCIPKYNEMIEKIKKEHMKFLHHKIIGWDMTIDENDNVICIEYNSNVPGIIQSQMVCGPIFNIICKNGNTLLDNILRDKDGK